MPAQELQAFLNQQVEVLQTSQNEFSNAMEWYIEEILKTAKKTNATLEKQAGNMSELTSSHLETQQKKMDMYSKKLLWIVTIPTGMLLVLELAPRIWQLIFPG